MTKVQGISKKPFPGWVNFVPALAHLFCLNLPAAFSQPGIGLIEIPCSLNCASRHRQYDMFVRSFLIFRGGGICYDFFSPLPSADALFDSRLGRSWISSVTFFSFNRMYNATRMYMEKHTLERSEKAKATSRGRRRCLVVNPGSKKVYLQ